MIKLENVSKEYRKGSAVVHALDRMSLSVKSGEFVAVRGPSGSGKTTLLLAAGVLLRPTDGKVIIDGQDVYQLNQNERACFRSETIGFVFQQYHLIPYLTIMENVSSPLLAHPMPDAYQRAKELIEQFGLSHRIDHIPAELSAGEKQRTALARALMNRPKILLADEITGNLDEQNAKVVLEHLQKFAQNGGTVLLVTHDAKVPKIADRIMTLEKGIINDKV